MSRAGRILRAIRAGGRVAWRSFLRFQDHHGPDRAAAVAHYTLLSLPRRGNRAILLE